MLRLFGSFEKISTGLQKGLLKIDEGLKSRQKAQEYRGQNDFWGKLGSFIGIRRSSSLIMFAKPPQSQLIVKVCKKLQSNCKNGEPTF